MTLRRYTPRDLDNFCLRMLDICSKVRRISREASQHRLSGLSLNDKKALESVARLEEWACKAETQLAVRLARVEGTRLARQE